MFVHLHNHTHYSILEWLPKPWDYVKKALELGMKSVAITDTMWVYGCHEFYKIAKKSWINPILWAEVLLNSSLDKKINHKLVLLAKSHNWYKNLIEIITKINLEWQNKIIWLQDIKEYSRDLIALSWPISWEIPFYILSWKKDEEIVEQIKVYENIFWKENFYLELLEHKDIPKQDLVTSRLIELANKHNLNLVATNNCYYIEKDDKNTQDVIQALWTWHELEYLDRPSLKNWDYSFLSEEEMNSIFWYIPLALENSSKIASEINIEIEMWKILIPVFKLSKEIENIFEEKKNIIKKENLKNLSSDEWYLRYLCYNWMNQRLKTNFWENELKELIKKKNVKQAEKALVDYSVEELRESSKIYYTDEKIKFIEKLDEKIKERIDRIEYELFVVHKMWFDTYFLIVADYINWAKNNSIPVWPGRWSAAWSLLAYLTWITDIDPMQFDLLFERFLNPARVSMPDIDTDFADTWRDKVIDYCRQRYGEDHLAQICTFGTFAARAAVKDVWRVRWINFSEMNEFAKMIPEKPWTKLKKALEESPEFKNAYDTNKKYKEIVDDALKIEWNVRQIWVHACAVIIAPDKMTTYTALQHPPKDTKVIITQYSAYPLEDLGLLKMDFLWLRNLTIIQRAWKILKNNKNIDLDIWNISLNDKKVLKIFATWDTTWVFQFESEWMRMWLKNLKPTSFDDIIAMVALYRPWPMKFIDTYIKRKYWEEKIDYMYEDLEKDLEKKYDKKVVDEERKKLFEDLSSFMDVTYGIAVYQEQLMRIVQSMAGFSLAEADLLRRWVWKKKKDVIEKLKIEFIDKAKKFRWYKEETSKTIYEQMIMPAADYSFNKSHAACYAYIAYQTAYLKAYYRTEFITSMMVSDEEDLDRIALEVSEAVNSGINILPPSINESMKHFTYIDDKNIRFWLKAIKGLWHGPIKQILDKREEIEGKKFTSLDEFVKIVWKEVINKKSLEALIKSWSLDDLWDRWLLFDNLEEILRFSKSLDNKKETNQIGLFDFSWDYEEKLILKKSKWFSYEETLFFEKEFLGFMVSGHPLDNLKTYCSKRSRNISYLKMSFDEIKESYEKLNSEEKKKKFISDIRIKSLKTIWLITDLRKILTKTWKNMIFLTCEGFDYDFDVTIFDREFNEIKNDVELGKIIVVEWNLNVDISYGRKTIISKKSNIYTLSSIRNQAIDLNLLDKSKRGLKIIQIKPDILDKNNTDLSEEKNIVEDKNNVDNIVQNSDKNYIVFIPNFAKKTDLIDLKKYLENLEKWEKKVYINIKWKKIYTKIKVNDLEKVILWEKEKWKN